MEDYIDRFLSCFFYTLDIFAGMFGVVAAFICLFILLILVIGFTATIDVLFNLNKDN